MSQSGMRACTAADQQHDAAAKFASSDINAGSSPTTDGDFSTAEALSGLSLQHRSTSPPGTLSDSEPEPRVHDEGISYGDSLYWDRRYEHELAPGSQAPPSFDWYMAYAGSPLQTLLRRHVPLEAPILHVGVGTSQLQREMVEDGYCLVMNTDISAVAVEYMRVLHENIPQLSYHIADCRHMPQFDDAGFGAVLDKGTLDAIMCGATAEADAEAMTAEAYRVLVPGGVYVEVSFGRPSRRLQYLTKLPPPLRWASVIAYGLRCQKPPGGADIAEADAAASLRVPLPPLLGPFDAVDAAAALDGREVNNYYYAYLCQKPEAAEAASLVTAADQQVSRRSSFSS